MRARMLQTVMRVVLMSAAAAAGPVAAAAQSDLDAAEAGAFLGTWVVDIDSEYGPFTLDLEITDQAGKVGVQIGSPEFGGMQEVTDVTMDGSSLVLRYEAEAQGQFFPVKVDLDPDGEGLVVGFDAADGQFFARGTGRKSDG